MWWDCLFTRPCKGTWPLGNRQRLLFAVWLQTPDCEGLWLCIFHAHLISILIQLLWVCRSLRKMYEGCRPQEVCEQMGLTELAKAISEKAPMLEACSGLCPVACIHLELWVKNSTNRLGMIDQYWTYFSRRREVPCGHLWPICPCRHLPGETVFHTTGMYQRPMRCELDHYLRIGF